MITVGDEKTSFHTWHHDVLAGNSSAKSEHWHIGVILTWATLDKWYQLSTKLYYDITRCASSRHISLLPTNDQRINLTV